MSVQNQYSCQWGIAPPTRRKCSHQAAETAWKLYVVWKGLDFTVCWKPSRV